MGGGEVKRGKNHVEKPTNRMRKPGGDFVGERGCRGRP